MPEITESCRMSDSVFDRYFATALLVVMSVQIVPVEGFDLSPIKISLMGLCLLVFLWRTPFISKSFIFSLTYWLVCFVTCYFQPYFRFSTLGYTGLYLIMFIYYYNTLYKGAFTLDYYQKILRYLIIAFSITLLAQQICVLAGLKNVPFLNLVGLNYSWNRLPTLTCEPSHTATILTGLFLGYLRCIEIRENKKVTLIMLLNKEHRIVTFSYLWLTFTMGSGTGWIGFGIICLYFLSLKTSVYIIPILIGTFAFLYHSGNEHFQRSLKVTTATLTGDIKMIQKADGSGSVRVVPLLNTINDLDLSRKETWIGKGTLSIEKRESAWKNSKRKIDIIEQYGIISFIFSLLLVFSCVIKRIISLETTCFIFLLSMALSNTYVTWSMLLVFASIRYFQVQNEQRPLFIDKSNTQNKENE